jgi:hypothetical protein
MLRCASSKTIGQATAFLFSFVPHLEVLFLQYVYLDAFAARPEGDTADAFASRRNNALPTGSRSALRASFDRANDLVCEYLHVGYWNHSKSAGKYAA